MGTSQGENSEPPGRKVIALLPTPLEFADRLTTAWAGPRIWIKRDDLTGFGISGNKVRKLEFHLHAAAEVGATTLITCGAVQSNHCRATAVVAARYGLGCLLFLRSDDGAPPNEITGNHLLQRLVGADVRFLSPDQYGQRDQIMEEAATALAATGETPWVIPEGASDHLGMLAFAHAAHELSVQVVSQIGRHVFIWHASSSAGTTAGLACGVEQNGLDATVIGVSVGDSEPSLRQRVDGLLPAASAYEITDRYVGLGYGRTTDDELTTQTEASALTGLIWDPTYTGKALYGLKKEIESGRFSPDDDVVFWHTGGGFAAFAHDFSRVL